MCVQLRRVIVSPGSLVLVLLGCSCLLAVVLLSNRYISPSAPAPVDLQLAVYGREVTAPVERGSVPSVMMDLFHRGPHEDLTTEIVQGVTPRIVDELVGIVNVYWKNLVLSQWVHNQGRVHFNCTDLIQQFHKLQRQRGGELQILVGVTMNRQYDEQPLVGGSDVDSQPLLLLMYTPIKPPANQSSVTEKPRRKRGLDAEDYEEESNHLWLGAMIAPRSRGGGRRTRSLCRRRPLYVDFSDINYDSWIVAPSGYQAYQCVGRCAYPLSDHLSPTKHAIVQTLLHSLHPSKTSTSCCVPTRLDSISILYLDQGILTYRLSYKDMVVAECGCR